MPPNKQRRRLWPWLAAITIVLALAILAAQFINGNGVFAGNRPPAVSVSSDHPKNIGEGVTVSGAAVPRDIKATAAPNAIQPPFKNYKAPTRPWHVLSITPSGKLKAPMNITLPLDHKVTKNDLVLVAVNHTHQANGWQYVGGTISADKQHITIQVTELSWFAPLWTDLVNMIKELKEQFFDGMTSNVFAHAKPPECDNESQARGDDYRISSDNKNTIYWCFGVEGGKRVLKVVNNRKYPLQIKRTNMVTKSRGHADLDFSQVVNLGDDVMLNGGDEAIFTVNSLSHGDIARLTTDLSKWSLGLHALDVIVGVLAEIIFKVNPPVDGGVGDFVQYFLDSKECVSALGDITNLGNFFKQCFSWDLLKEAFNWQVALAAPVMTAFSVLDLGLAIKSAIEDSGNGKSKYTVTVSRPEPNPFDSFRPNGDAHWHVHGEEVYINADGTGMITWNAGPCSSDITSDNMVMCTGMANVRYTPSGNKLSGKVTAMEYKTSDGSQLPSTFDPGDYTIKQGDTFTLSHQSDRHLLTMHWDRPPLQGGNENLCDAYASARNNTTQYNVCGA